MSKRFWTISIPNEATALDIVIGAHLLVLRGELVGRVRVEVLFQDVQVELGFCPDQVECAQSAEVLLLLEVQQDLRDLEVGLVVDRVDDAVDFILRLLELDREGEREGVGHPFLVLHRLVSAPSGK